MYLKSDIGKGTGDVFAYNGEKSVKLANAANAFQLEKGDNIVILKNYDSNASDPTATSMSMRTARRSRLLPM